MTDLAKRAVACKGWRWQGGELAHVGRNPVRVSDAIAKTWNRTLDPGAHQPLPDFTDHATLGCLLALVREAWGDACITSDWTGANVYGWTVRNCRGKMLVLGNESEAAALVAALEAAPTR